MIGLVIDVENEKTDLVILDAARFEDAPVAIIHLPHRVPPGFHGNWRSPAVTTNLPGAHRHDSFSNGERGGEPRRFDSEEIDQATQAVKLLSLNQEIGRRLSRPRHLRPYSPHSPD